LGRQRQTNHRRTAPCSLDRERSPAAANVEQALTWLEVEAVEQGPHLAQLRLLEAVIRRRKSGAAIGHRRIEPRRIEVVAEVVVGGDVLPRLARGVVPKTMGNRVQP